MKRIIRILLFAAFMPVLLNAQATTFRSLSLAEMIAAAEIVIHGTVVSAEAEMRAGDPWTTVTFEVAEYLLVPEDFEAEAAQFSLDFLGGTASGNQLTVALMPRFEAGDEVLLFAYDSAFASPLVGFNQALWLLSPAGEWTDVLGNPLGLDDDGNLSTETASPAAEVTRELVIVLEAR